jgi:NAD(P)-dependent dehydrogenase (short-subunit alcohol dehydrogenase family)
MDQVLRMSIEETGGTVPAAVSGSPLSFEGRRVLVTGGSSGIGAATVVGFARAGALVISTGRDERRLAEVAARASEVGAGRVRTFRADLRDDSDLEALVAEAWSDGPLDVLVNNAGIGTAEPFLEATPEGLRELIDTNLVAPFLLAQRTARRMVDSGGGVIVNVASTDAFVAESPLAAYCASKAGILALTRSIAWELGHLGIRCNAICPGLTRTPMIEADLDSGLEAAYLPRIPLGRIGSPEEQASAILFLASDEASFVNGAPLLCDGGQLAGFWYHPRYAPTPTASGSGSPRAAHSPTYRGAR